MDFALSADDRQLVERATALAREFATRAREYDEAASFPKEDFARLREEGFLALTVPRFTSGYPSSAPDESVPGTIRALPA